MVGGGGGVGCSAAGRREYPESVRVYEVLRRHGSLVFQFCRNVRDGGLKCPCQLGSAQKSSEVFRCQENGSWQSSCAVLLSINWSYMLIINYRSNAAGMLKRPREFTGTKKAIIVQVVLGCIRSARCNSISPGRDIQ